MSARLISFGLQLCVLPLKLHWQFQVGPAEASRTYINEVEEHLSAYGDTALFQARGLLSCRRTGRLLSGVGKLLKLNISSSSGSARCQQAGSQGIAKNVHQPVRSRGGETLSLTT